MKKLTAFVLSAMMVLSLAACGAKTETPADTSTPAADATKPAEVAKLTYAVEAGSAGEEVALANGYNVVSVDSQAKGTDGSAGWHRRCRYHRLPHGRRHGG